MDRGNLIIMKQCTKCKENKELTNFTKQKSRKDGLNPWCKLCCKKDNASYRDKNKESVDLYNATYRSEHKEEAANYQTTYRTKNKEQKAIKDAEYYQKNKEKTSKRRAIYHISYYETHKEELSVKGVEYRKANPGKINALTAKRHVAKLQRTPKWINKEQLLEIQAIYIEAARLTKETGIPHEVDHTIPLQGKNISGLHILDNLQVLPKSLNNSKNNKFDAKAYDALNLPLLIKQTFQINPIESDKVA